MKPSTKNKRRHESKHRLPQFTGREEHNIGRMLRRQQRGPLRRTNRKEGERALPNPLGLILHREAGVDAASV